MCPLYHLCIFQPGMFLNDEYKKVKAIKFMLKKKGQKVTNNPRINSPQSVLSELETVPDRQSSQKLAALFLLTLFSAQSVQTFNVSSLYFPAKHETDEIMI